MHRSGTSLAASVLQSAGVDFGDDFVPANEHNPQGYFEDVAINRVHIRVNRLLNRRPLTAAGLADYPASFRKSRQAKDCIDELEMLVRKRLEHTDQVWGFKDPHTINFLPLWDELFRRIGARPVYVLAIRHPSAVAASTVKRDGISAGHGELLWIDQNIAALRHTAYRIPVIVDYDGWFAAPLVQAQRMLAALGLEPDVPGLEALLQDIINPGLNHQPVAGEMRLPFAGELYRQLIQVIDGADLEESTRPMVDRYRQAKDLFAPALELLECEHRLRHSKEHELELLQLDMQQQVNGLTRRLNLLAELASTFLASRTGRLVYRYQLTKRQLTRRDKEGAALLQLKKLLDSH